MRKFLPLVIVIVILGLLATVYWRPKTTIPTPVPMTHSFTITNEKDFLENMIPHHKEAVDTSILTGSQSQDAEFKVFTQNVVEDQTKEIAQMKEWLRTWYSVDYTDNSKYEPMMTNLTQFKNVEQEKVYVEGMIRHHQGAIEMAKKMLTLNPREEMKLFAQNIISAQELEVTLLQQWLTSKYSTVRGEDKAPHEIQVH